MARRVMILPLSAQAIVGMLSTGPRRWELLESALPDDARLVDIRADAWRAWVEVLVESETFPELHPGAQPPYLPFPTWRIPEGADHAPDQ